MRNIFSLSKKSRFNVFHSWFGRDGAGYNLVRVPIGGTDFSEFPYSLDDTENDFALEHFSLSKIDENLRIPFLKNLKRISNDEVKLLASAWSSPVWMKTNEKFNGIGKLKGQPGDIFHKTWANYYVKVRNFF